MAREGFVVYHEILDWIEPFGDAECGRLLKQMLKYSIAGEAEELSGNEKYIWPAIRAKIDRDKEAYQASCERNKRSIMKRYESIPEATTVYDRIPEATTVYDGTQDDTAVYGRIRDDTTAYDNVPNLPTETETETETETKTETKKSVAHARGQFGWVKLTDEQYARLQQELGQEELDRCIAYVDEAAQQTGNKNKWKDWNLTIRKCHRDGWGIRGKQYTTAKEYYGRQKPAASPEEIKSLIDRI